MHIIQIDCFGYTITSLSEYRNKAELNALKKYRSIYSGNSYLQQPQLPNEKASFNDVYEYFSGNIMELNNGEVIYE
jgi:hypothetical protein|tara:strand:- start:171 stop:398 length:228 start_codon:yes stop_codon:yes gene_type:complete